jgi:hypothetical protein
MAQERWTLRVEHVIGAREFRVSSADAGKTLARELKPSVPGAKFEIYDPQGSLYQFSVSSGGRMKWVWSKR